MNASQSAARAGATAAKASANAANGATRVLHKITGASGASRTGLAQLIELSAAGSIGDGFVAVALAGTLFFSASPTQARGKVALALIITMAPFALLAPFIGPMLDRVRHGRKFILIGTVLARGLLCWGMAGAVQHNDSLTLLPAAFGVLLLQKAYGVTRASVTPRLLPSEITLVTANSRCALASLIATSAGVPVAAGIAAITGGGSGGAAWVLRVGTLIYLLAMVPAIRLPDGVDEPMEATAEASANGAADTYAQNQGGSGAHGPGAHGRGSHAPGSHAPGSHGAGQYGPGSHGPGQYGADSHRADSHWAGPHGAGPHGAGVNGDRSADTGREAVGGPAGALPNGQRSTGATSAGSKGSRWKLFPEPVSPVVIEALQANITLRAYSGFMIFFLAFLLRTVHFGSVSDKLALGEMITAVAVGGFIGTAIGAALRSRAPQVMVFSMLAYSAIATTLCAAFFGLWAAIIVAFSAAVCQTLVKLALDSIVQREVRPEVRSSTFAASETLHQLSWVMGGLLGLLLSLTNGVIGLAVAAAGLTLAFCSLLIARRNRILRARTPAPAST